jgi:DNA-directed RNA polymerase specialized sigma24 family protein
LIRKPAWSLTEEAFSRLLAQLDPDRDRAAEKYELIRRKLTTFFKWRGCLQFEDYADKTIDRVARKLTEGAELQPDSPLALFYGVAANILREHWRKSLNEPVPLSDQAEMKDGSNDPETIRERAQSARERDARLGCLKDCLGKLPADSLDLINQYYSEGEVLNKEQRKRMAEQLQLSAVALRSRAFRIRGELEKCVKNCREKLQ